MISFIYPLVIACFLTAIFIKFSIPLAYKFGLVDHPHGRKQHKSSTPLVGGICIIFALILTLACLGWINNNQVGFIISLLLFLLLGLADDYKALNAKFVFLTQMVLSYIFINFSCVSVLSFGALLGDSPIHTGHLSSLVTMIAIVGMINAINMADGLDGIAGGVVLIALGWLSLMSYLAGVNELILFSSVLMGGLIGFLFYNLESSMQKNAKVFLGNAGTMSLGLVISWFSIQLTQHSDSTVSPIIAVWVVGLPLMDMARVIMHRLLRGNNPFHADRSHLHYLLIDFGCSERQTLLIKLALSLALGAFGFLGWLFSLDDWIMFSTFMVVLSIYFVLFELIYKKYNQDK